MTPIALIGKGQQMTMSSLELVDFINGHRREESESYGYEFPCEKFPKLRHDHFIDKVHDVLRGVPLQRETYKHPQNGQHYTMYRFAKREACLLAMSYSYELQAKVYDRMTELEEGSKPKVPQTLAQALRLAADQAEQIERQEVALALAAPKVEFVDRYVESTGLKGFREVAKLLKANEARFSEFLEGSKTMYRLAGRLTPHQNHIDAGRFQVRTGVAENEHSYTSAKFTPKGVAWIAGEWAKHKLHETEKGH